VRHPIYLAWFLLVWCAPFMNGTRAVFAAVSCLYLMLAIPFEERDLRRVFGKAYAEYAARVRWRVIPWLY
jgi:protein-S-isoprenylcysteine O-methyltransferase Ste14